MGRLKNWGDDASWRDFFDTYWKLIYNFSIKRGLSHQESEEVVQETVLAVAKSIDRFRYAPEECSFKTWLLKVTLSQIGRQLRKRARLPARCSVLDDSRITPLIERLPDEAGGRQWERTWEIEWHQNIMDMALQRMKQRVSIEQFQIFDLFVLKGWQARDVAHALRLTVANVYVTKHRLAKMVKREVALLEQRGR